MNVQNEDLMAFFLINACDCNPVFHSNQLEKNSLLTGRGFKPIILISQLKALSTSQETRVHAHVSVCVQTHTNVGLISPLLLLRIISESGVISL